jgi:hypothetical protein
VSHRVHVWISFHAYAFYQHDSVSPSFRTTVGLLATCNLATHAAATTTMSHMHMCHCCTCAIVAHVPLLLATASHPSHTHLSVLRFELPLVCWPLVTSPRTLQRQQQCHICTCAIVAHVPLLHMCHCCLRPLATHHTHTNQPNCFSLCPILSSLPV